MDGRPNKRFERFGALAPVKSIYYAIKFVVSALLVVVRHATLSTGMPVNGGYSGRPVTPTSANSEHFGPGLGVKDPSEEQHEQEVIQSVNAVKGAREQIRLEKR